MRLSHLLELTAQAPIVQEAKTDMSDLDGIKSLVDDCIADLVDKLGADGSLAEFAKKTGMDKLDTEKDNEGMTILPKLAKTVKDFKKTIEALMTEVELMAASMPSKE
jgi:hypothetical protein